MRYLFVFTIVISVFSCKKSPIEPQIVHKEYTIEGVFYDKDGVTPLSNYPLELLAEIEQPFSSGSQFEYPASTTTDEKGYFKLTYRGNDDYTNLDLGQPASKTPVYGPFITEIPLNQNIQRDACLFPRNFIKLKIDIRYSLNEGDTIFLDPILGSPLNDTTFKFAAWGLAATDIYIYIYTKHTVINDNTWLIPSKKHNTYSGEEWAIRWGKGRQNMIKAGELAYGVESGSKDFGVYGFEILSFPDTTEVTLTIE